MKKAFYILIALLATSYIAWSLCFMWQRGMIAKSPSLDMQQMQHADSAILRAIDNHEFPGAVLCVVRRAADGESMGEIAYLKAYGHRSVLSKVGVADSVAMTCDAVFDLASLSKCMGTTLAVMRLVEDGKLRLTDCVDSYIEDFKPWDSIVVEKKPKRWNRRNAEPKTRVVESRRITIKHLLTHTSGLPAFINMTQFMERYAGCGDVPASLKDSLLKHIAVESPRMWQPGSKVRYSCLNFVILQAIIERLSECELDEFLSREVFEPLGLQHTKYHDLDDVAVRCDTLPIVPTELQADGTVLRGVTHDPIAHLINRGVSGNAGLFSTAEDLAVVASMLMNGGVVRLPEEGWKGKLGFTKRHRFYGELTVKTFFSVPESLALHQRALGWNAEFDKGGCYGDLMTPHQVVSHTGFTGTSIAIDYAEGVAVILLTNRVHPKAKGSIAATRAAVANVVMGAM